MKPPKRKKCPYPPGSAGAESWAARENERFRMAVARYRAWAAHAEATPGPESAPRPPKRAKGPAAAAPKGPPSNLTAPVRVLRSVEAGSCPALEPTGQRARRHVRQAERAVTAATATVTVVNGRVGSAPTPAECFPPEEFGRWEFSRTPTGIPRPPTALAGGDWARHMHGALPPTVLTVVVENITGARREPRRLVVLQTPGRLDANGHRGRTIARCPFPAPPPGAGFDNRHLMWARAMCAALDRRLLAP